MTQPATTPEAELEPQPVTDPSPDPATDSAADPEIDDDGTPRCANIGERGAAARRRHGLIAGIAGIGVGIYMIAAELPTSSLWVLLVPFTWAALGFLQAREKT